MADENTERLPREETPASRGAGRARAAAAAAAGAPPSPPRPLAPKERRRRARAAKAAQGPYAAAAHARGAPCRAGRWPPRQVDGSKHPASRASASKRAATTSPRRRRRRASTRPGKPKTRLGVVVSDAADKTITVRIDVTRRHPRYEKIVRTSSTLHAHDERNDAHSGDTVIVRESRPLSRTKRWRLVEVVERAR